MLLALHCNAQKPSMYLGDDFKQIPKAEYEKQEDEKHLLLSFETDSLLVFVKTKRETFGTLSAEDLEKVHIAYDVTTSQKKAKNNTIVIQYYPGKDYCNSSGSKGFVKKKYKVSNKKIVEKPNTVPFFIFKDDKGLKPYKAVVDWYKDPDQLFETLFFPLHYNCSSFVIIKSNGDYFSYKGEYSNTQLFTVLDSERFSETSND